MKAKTKETISRWVLVVGASVSLGTAVALVINPQFPYRSILVQEQILDATIGLFGVLSAGFIAAIALLYVNRQTQTYSWRRDQALKDIDTIYEPLYQDVSRVAEMIELLDSPNYGMQVHSWERIKNSYLGTKLKLMEQQLYEDLQHLLNNYPEYSDKRENVLEMVTAIAREIIEKRLDEKIAKGNLGLKEAIPAGKPEEPVRTVKDEILALMPERLTWGLRMCKGLLTSKSIRKLSASQTGDEQQYLEHIATYVNEDGTSYSKYLKFDVEEIESILDELHHEVQTDARTKEIVSWGEALNQRAQRLKNKLEDRILKPQLP